MGKGVVTSGLRMLILCSAVTACNEQACPRDALVCDGVYVPYVAFTFTRADTGGSFCGPAEIDYVSHRCGQSGSASCDCVSGTMHGTGSSGMDCNVNPPLGETSDITVRVDGFQPFDTTVSLPYECAPRVDVEVLLEE